MIWYVQQIQVNAGLILQPKFGISFLLFSILVYVGLSIYISRYRDKVP